MRRGLRSVLAVAVAALAMTMDAQPIKAQTSPSRILLSPRMLDPTQGNGEVDVIVDGGEDFHSYEITLTWDPSLFALTAVSPPAAYADLDSEAPPPFLAFDVDVDNGTVQLRGERSQRSPEPEQGDLAEGPIFMQPSLPSVVLARLTFAALTVGQSNLQYDATATSLFDTDGEPLERPELTDAVLSAAVQPDEATSAEIRAEAAALASAGTDDRGAGNVVADAVRRVGGAIANGLGLSGESTANRAPLLAWLGVLSAALLLVLIGWLLGRPQDA